MKTEITLDKQALADLIKDPEVKIKIHDAVVDGIARKVIRNTSDEIKKKVMENVDGMIMSVLRSDCGQMFYPRPSSPSGVQLAVKAIDAIKVAVNDAFMEKARHEVYDRLNKLEDKLRKQVDDTWNLLMKKDRIGDVITYHIKELVETGLKKALGCSSEGNK